MRKHGFSWFAVGLLAISLPVVVGAQEAAGLKKFDEASGPKTVKSGAAVDTHVMYDPAFDKYVDPQSLLPAFQSRNAALLTDLALQIAFGESVLERPRKGFTARDMAVLALATAAETGDKASLERLAKFAAKTNDAQMTGRLSIVKPSISIIGGNRRGYSLSP